MEIDLQEISRDFILDHLIGAYLSGAQNIESFQSLELMRTQKGLEDSSDYPWGRNRQRI